MHAACAICGQMFEARTSYGLCPLCWNRDRLREWDRLTTAQRRAERANLPATLTLVQWLSVLSDFQGLCAYCQEVSFSGMEVVERRLGLAYGNVVPICRACAVHRAGSFDHACERVEAYLDAARKSAIDQQIHMVITLHCANEQEMELEEEGQLE